MSEESKTVKIHLNSAPHERLNGLLGGDDSGHYHLSEEEYGLVSEVIEERRIEDEEGGGFHKLREEEYAKLLDILDMFFADEDAELGTTLASLMDARIAEYLKTIDSGEIKSPVEGG